MFWTILEHTLLDRYLIYSEMLLLFEEGNPPGFCMALTRVSSPERPFCQSISGDTLISYPSLLQLPELVKRKPENSFIMGHWFEPFDNEPRIKILEEAIEDVLDQMDYDLDNY